MGHRVIRALGYRVIGAWGDGVIGLYGYRWVCVFITNVKGTFFGMSESEEASKRR